LQKRADLNVVTNKYLAMDIENNSGKTFVLEDKVPKFKNFNKIKLKGKYNIAFVCTFQKDEPYTEVINSGELIDQSIYIYITGSHSKVKKRNYIENAPKNIIFCGYLPSRKYLELLYSSDLIMDLTLMEDCLVCGAYEGLSFDKPLILSKTKATKEYFQSGAVFTGNTSREIAASINFAIQNIDQIKSEIKILKKNIEYAWSKKMDLFREKIFEL
jgi:glycosyltransferase involved in cell wall biosynthesis